MFFKGSRYAKVPTLMHTDASGRAIAYKGTRFVGPVPALEGHLVLEGERLDHLAWQHYRDPERYWRICDANLAVWPDDLLEPAAILRIPSVEG
jgi:hypothetical protein